MKIPASCSSWLNSWNVSKDIETLWQQSKNFEHVANGLRVTHSQSRKYLNPKYWNALSIQGKGTSLGRCVWGRDCLMFGTRIAIKHVCMIRITCCRNIMTIWQQR